MHYKYTGCTMSPALLNLRMHKDSSERIRDEFSNLLNINIFKDILLVCSNGNFSLDQLSIGLLFPFLQNIFSEVGFSEGVIILPDFKISDTLDNLRKILGVGETFSVRRREKLPKTDISYLSIETGSTTRNIQHDIHNEIKKLNEE